MDAAARLGIALTQRGLVDVFPVFNRHGWYWGAEFSGDSVDSMHFEWSDESIRHVVDSLARLQGPGLAPLKQAAGRKRGKTSGKRGR